MTDDENIYKGLGLIGDLHEPTPVTIVVKNGIITHVEEETRAPDFWICPAFFNAHTHLGDTVAMDIPCTGDLTELVTPPNGLKHQILAATPGDKLVRGMRASVSSMVSCGTAGFADFREGGEDGVLQLQEACSTIPCHPIILGRCGGENISHGAGISSARDVVDYEEIVQRMKREGKLVAFHAGERDGSDIDAALACEPDLLVHCTHAAPHHLRAIADEGISVVLCPRSNFLLGVTSSASNPPIKEMIQQEINILFGTDNAMFVNPDIMQEISFCHTLYGIDTKTLFSAVVKGFPPGGLYHEIKSGNKANFFIVDVTKGNLSFSHDPVASMVKRSPTQQICATIFYV